MKKLLAVLFTLTLLTSGAFAQGFGTVSGTVHDSLNNPVQGAMITFNGPERHHYFAQSGTDGSYSIASIVPGIYFGEASKMMVGHDEQDSVQVVAGQNTVVDFVLVSEHNPPPPPPPPPPIGDTGSVSGMVRDTLNNPVNDASIELMGMGGHHRHGDPGANYHAHSDSTGAFFISNVLVGNYMAMASKMMVGRDQDSVTVTANQNSVVNFVLQNFCNPDTGGHHGGGRGDSLEIVNLTGWAIVVQDSLRTHYFLDVNGDDTADFRLQFGPPWYEPTSGAHRPADGDSVSITGGLIGYGAPQAVVVYTINGLFWRQPGHGHGGHGGHGGGYPHPDSLIRIEASGQAIVEGNPTMNMYFLDTNFDDTVDYVLNFGPPNYNPDNGATRPENGDSISVVGGLMEGRTGQLDMIIVYEINGQIWWRDPGDTLDLWLSVTSTTDPGASALPINYLVTKSYPNPFNPTAVISFELPSSELVKVTVYDLLGREIAVLADGVYPAGQSQVQFNPGSVSGSAVYFYKVSAGDQSATGKMILLK